MAIIPSPPPRACLRSTPVPVSTPQRPSTSAPPFAINALQPDNAAPCICSPALLFDTATMSAPQRPSTLAPPLTVNALQLDDAASCACVRALYPATSAAACSHQRKHIPPARSRRDETTGARPTTDRWRHVAARTVAHIDETNSRRTHLSMDPMAPSWHPPPSLLRSPVDIDTRARLDRLRAMCADWVSECSMRARF